MTPPSAFSRDTDLTGLWSGEYWYGDGAGQPTPFSAHIVDTGGSLTGSTLEPNTSGIPGPAELSASLTGSRGELSVRFIKLYNPAPGIHGQPIRYAGTADAAFTMIDGDWRLDHPGGSLAGRFVLVRVSRGANAEAKVRKAQLELALGR